METTKAARADLEWVVNQIRLPSADVADAQRWIGSARGLLAEADQTAALRDELSLVLSTRGFTDTMVEQAVEYLLPTQSAA